VESVLKLQNVLPVYRIIAFACIFKTTIFIIQVLAYIKSPYNYVNNTQATTSAIVKVVITDAKGKRLDLQDLDDPVDMAVDMTQVRNYFVTSHLLMLYTPYVFFVDF
jgi:hypothetical protein